MLTVNIPSACHDLTSRYYQVICANLSSQTLASTRNNRTSRHISSSFVEFDRGGSFETRGQVYTVHLSLLVVTALSVLQIKVQLIKSFFPWKFLSLQP